MIISGGFRALSRQRNVCPGLFDPTFALPPDVVSFPTLMTSGLVGGT